MRRGAALGLLVFLGCATPGAAEPGQIFLMPDTQATTQDWLGTFERFQRDVIDRLCQREALAGVLQLGDLVHHFDRREEEWTRASQAFDRFEAHLR